MTVMITSKERQRKILKEMHECAIDGHQGVQHNYDRLKLYVTWPSMFQDVECYIKRCEVCQRNKFKGPNIKAFSKKRILSINHAIEFIYILWGLYQ